MAREDVIKEFSSLKGVGKAKAELLYDSGFTSIAKLKKATLSEISAVKGITEKSAQDLLDQLKDKKEATKKEPEKITSESAQKKVKKPIEEKPIPKEKKEKKPQKEEKVEIVQGDEEVYKVKKKPELSDEMKKRLKIRKQVKKRTPEFLREEWFRYKKIPKNWRKPDGITSKMRMNLKYRPNKVRVGFRGPRETRNLHSSGFEEVFVYNTSDVENINPKTQAARIGASVGTKKRLEIEKKADELNIRILNRSQ
jgi:large subunit ribosomal protein L32e